jgi:hypothetical protein
MVWSTVGRSGTTAPEPSPVALALGATPSTRAAAVAAASTTRDATWLAEVMTQGSLRFVGPA